MEIHFSCLTSKLGYFLSVLLHLAIRHFSPDWACSPTPYCNYGGQWCLKNDEAAEATYNSSLCVFVCGLFESLQLAPQGVAVDVDSNIPWQWEKAFTQTLGPLNAVAMGDDASWLCCCHGNSCTWPNLVQSWHTKGRFSSTARTISFVSSEWENRAKRNIFPKIFTIP